MKAKERKLIEAGFSVSTILNDYSKPATKRNIYCVTIQKGCFGGEPYDTLDDAYDAVFNRPGSIWAEILEKERRQGIIM